MYLLSDTGSEVEKPHERGVAHFLEHMVFKGSKNYPGNQTMETLEKLGLRIGKQYNASVDDSKTEYRVFIPENNTATLNQVLLLFKDWMCDLQMDDASFKVEQKVVIEEINKRSNTPSPLLTGTILEGHDGLGSIEQINSVTAKTVKDFYKKYYTPEQLSIVINGNVDVKKVSNYIETLFGSIKASPNKITQKYPDITTKTVINGTIKNSKKEKDPLLTIAFKFPDTPINSYSSFKQQIGQILFSNILENRLLQLPNSQIGNSSVNLGSPVKGSKIYNVRLQGDKNVSYKQMLTDFSYVINQANTHGFLQEEIDFFLNRLINSYKRFGDDDFISYHDVKKHFLTGDAPITGKKKLALVQSMKHQFIPKDFEVMLNDFIHYHKTILFDNTSTAFQQDFTNEYILNTLKNYDRIKTEPYTFKEPKGGFDFSQKKKVLEEVIIDIKTPSEIKEKITLGENLYLLKYANGVSVVVNKNQNTSNKIKIVGKHGLDIIPEKDRGLLSNSLKSLNDSFGKYSKKEAYKLLRNLGIYKRVDLSNFNFEFELKGSDDNFDQLIKVFNLLVTEENLPEVEDLQRSISIQQKRKKSSNELDNFFDKAVGKSLATPNNNDTIISKEVAARLLNYNSILKRNLKNSFVYVGGTLPKNVDEMISTYIATITPGEVTIPQTRNNNPLPIAKTLVKEFPWGKKSLSKVNYLFNLQRPKQLTLKDKLITEAISEYGFIQIFNILRKKHGFIYSMGTTGYTTISSNTSSVSLRYIVDSDNLNSSREAAINEIITPMSKGNITKDDVLKMKNILKTNYALNFYDEERVSGDYLNWGLNYGKLFTLDEFQKKIDDISKRDIKRSMKNIINTNKHFILINMPMKK
ncbi:insulinase family protein [Tenacibaculum aestuarii]|uniref:insulinase family protein n=1 Tax=Tenacibaculum aestuarii TaxID=362781 RepID=UPI0038B5B598